MSLENIGKGDGKLDGKLKKNMLLLLTAPPHNTQTRIHVFAGTPLSSPGVVPTRVALGNSVEE